MRKALKASRIVILIIIIISIYTLPVFANNLSITNVSLGERNPSSATVVVKFDISWENSWRTKINHDAIWLTVRLHDAASSPTNKQLCQITASGINPSGASAGSNAQIEFYVPTDRRGVFVRPSNYGMYGSVSSTDAQLTIDYSTCGFADSADVYATVFGLEMVYIPEGSFYIGDYDTSTAALDEGSSDSDPWYIASESAISVANPGSDGYRYVSGGNSGEDSTGASFSIPGSFPKGYGAFYVMKYEVTEGQWVEFVNSLSTQSARSNRDLTNATHKNTDTVQFRNTMSCSGSPLTCTTDRPYRALSYITWMDLAAFLDWAALRPITELEYEKTARGPLMAVAGEFAWGSTSITAAATISAGIETGSETVTNSGANAHYNNTTLTGGDADSGSEYSQGALRSGVFATGSSDRSSAGAGYYGTTEISGNLRERTVTIGNATGRNFSASHGDGVLSTTSGYEGNATNTDWPGIDDDDTTRGVTGALGSGFRGGGWNDQSSGARLRISDRTEAANASTASSNNSGGRGARTYDGN